MSELYDAPESPRMTRAVQWLLALNIGVYFLQLTLFGQDAVYSALALDPARFPGADPGVGIPHTEGVRHGDRNRLPDRRLVGGQRDQHLPTLSAPVCSSAATRSLT